MGVTIDGEEVARGNAIGLGRGQSFQVGFLRPGHTEWENSTKSITAGSNMDICISTGTTLEEFQHFSERELNNIDVSNLTRVLSNEEINKGLHYTGLLYFALVDYLGQAASSKYEIIAVNHISLGFVCKEIKPVYSLKCFLFFC